MVSLSVGDINIQHSADSIVQYIGPTLTQIAIHNVGGNAARTDLGSLSELIRKLVVRHVEAKVWIEQALTINFPSDRVTLDDKKVFFGQLVR